jgi:hypothetical protein
MYKTLVRPILEYASIIWSPTRIGLINQLEKVQRKMSKWIIRDPTIPYAERLRKLQLPSLKWRRNYLDLLRVYQIMHGNPKYRSQIFTLNSDVTCSTIQLRRHRLTIYKSAHHSAPTPLLESYHQSVELAPLSIT